MGDGRGGWQQIGAQAEATLPNGQRGITARVCARHRVARLAHRRQVEDSWGPKWVRPVPSLHPRVPSPTTPVSLQSHDPSRWCGVKWTAVIGVVEKGMPCARGGVGW